MTEIHKKLVKIQSELKAPKNQYNNFGKYSYRSCEDIVEAVKPLLHAEGIGLVLEDEIINIGNHNYIKATVIISDGKDFVKASAVAREAESRKGMDDSQITGATSSYARKYALNGLFAIDDTKDADTKKPVEYEEIGMGVMEFDEQLSAAKTHQYKKKIWEAHWPEVKPQCGPEELEKFRKIYDKEIKK